MDNDESLHAFTDDALGALDATGVAAAIASGEVSCLEVIDAAISRADLVDPPLGAIVYSDWTRARAAAGEPHHGVFAGVPTFIKDNTEVAGMPTHHGSRAVTARVAKTDEAVTTEIRDTGAVILGKSSLPEFGLSATTEFGHDGQPPARNPWNLDYSVGASSGGTAALVAAGVVPFAHGNDGGGSIRIPAAAAGLVGLKPSRGREARSKLSVGLPVDIISNGILTRTVRDTAAFWAGVDAGKLPPIGEVTGPSSRRLRIGLWTGTFVDADVDSETLAAVTNAANLAEQMGHRVETLDDLPAGDKFVGAFTHYWAMLGYAIAHFGRQIIGPGFDKDKLDTLTVGLAKEFSRRKLATPGAVFTLRRSSAAAAQVFSTYDVVLSPVVTSTTPLLGQMSPKLGFEEAFSRVVKYTGFTPLANAAGTPAISLPLGRTSNGMPIGVMASAGFGAERTLLELAFAFEEAQPFARLGA